MIALRVVGWAASALAWTAAALVGLGILLGVGVTLLLPTVLRRIREAGGVAPEDTEGTGGPAIRSGAVIKNMTSLPPLPNIFDSRPEPTDKIAQAIRIRDRAQEEIDRLNREGLRRVAKIWAPGSLN